MRRHYCMTGVVLQQDAGTRIALVGLAFPQVANGMRELMKGVLIRLRRCRGCPGSPWTSYPVYNFVRLSCWRNVPGLPGGGYIAA
jgi:hypothetical protein